MRTDHPAERLPPCLGIATRRVSATIQTAPIELRDHLLLVTRLPRADIKDIVRLCANVRLPEHTAIARASRSSSARLSPPGSASSRRSSPRSRDRMPNTGPRPWLDRCDRACRLDSHTESRFALSIRLRGRASLPCRVGRPPRHPFAAPPARCRGWSLASTVDLSRVRL